MDSARLEADELRSELRKFMLVADGGSAPPKSSPPSATLRVHLALDCAYQQLHYRQALERRTYMQHTSMADATLAIDEYEAIEWEEVMSKGSAYQAVSSFCIRKALCRKANMANALEKHCTKCRGDDGTSACPLLKTLPQTVVIDSLSVFETRPAWLDFRSALVECLCDAEDAMEKAGPGVAWILKPSLTNKGAGIRIVADIETVEAAIREEQEVGQWVLQRYLANPLLLTPSSPAAPEKRHKFHLRVYVVAVGALTVYVYKEALVLFAVQPYQGAGLDAEASHITNTCIGANHEGFVETDHVRCLSELPQMLVADGYASDATQACAMVDSIWKQICRQTAHAFAGQAGNTGGYMPIPHCFEAYGVDFLVDDHFNVVLLEFNPSPDIKQTGSRLDHVIDGMVDGLVAVAVDRRLAPTTDEAGNKSYKLNVEPAVPTGGTFANGVVCDLTTFAPHAADKVWQREKGRLVRGPIAASAQDSGDGWQMVYSKRWEPAHQQMTVSFS
jgi:tubulin--tyrosine ligase